MSENLEIQMSVIAMKLNDSFTCRRLDLMMNNRDCKNLTRLFLFPKLFSILPLLQYFQNFRIGC